MSSQMRQSSALSRRTLVAAGTGWVLGAGGLFLPASSDEAEAREGALDGKAGGRRGKDYRGRDKGRRDREHRVKHHRIHKKGDQGRQGHVH